MTLEEQIKARIAELKAERERVIADIIDNHPVVAQYNAGIGELERLLNPPVIPQ